MAEAPPPPQKQASPSPSSVAELIVSFEQAIMAAKQLPSTAVPSHLLQIHSSFQHVHNHLSAFLSRPQFPLPLLPPQENALSSAAATADPMQLGDDDENDNGDVEQVNSRGIVDGVEEKMRNCFIKNKRRKRRLSASALEERTRFIDDGFGAVGEGFDPYATRLRALELVYQFHG
ncbi:hypothetical protein L484_017001 [Morus notabilis]|uniref:Uncharacterized protein n=1 Tax=Morus notabilis TaxID=981085 RepID=W9RU47_9ROSA|nr:uncharacterized protein LOC21400024 [Morus notabilis]EXB96153.1 hypothetical protein L484_017001 [Morus notabilis]